jgi:hypothetical protein
LKKVAFWSISESSRPTPSLPTPHDRYGGGISIRFSKNLLLTRAAAHRATRAFEQIGIGGEGGSLNGNPEFFSRAAQSPVSPILGGARMRSRADCVFQQIDNLRLANRLSLSELPLSGNDIEE